MLFSISIGHAAQLYIAKNSINEDAGVKCVDY